MNRNALILLIAFMLAYYTGSAQAGYKIRGYIFDSLTSEPVENAEIIVSGFTKKAITDKTGFFLLTAPTPECEAELHCISYHTKKQVLSSALISIIYISHRSYNLSSVEISANKPRDLMPGISYQIMDYEFSGENIILLAYERQSLFLPKLLLINSKGDTLSAVSVSKPLRLCRDFEGKVHFMSKTTSYEINTDGNNISLCNPISNEDFERINNTIVCHDGHNYYLRQYMNNDQILNYYNYNQTLDKLDCFRTITDIETIRRNRHGVYFDGKEEDIRFQQLIMNSAVKAPLIKINDTIFLFNYLESRLEKYSITSDTLAHVDINFHRNKSFSEDLFLDNEQSKVYAMYRDKGISQVKEISTNNGAILQTIDIPDFVFIEKIKIHDGTIYFLYKSKDLSEYKKLYTMKI